MDYYKKITEYSKVTDYIVECKALLHQHGDLECDGLSYNITASNKHRWVAFFRRIQIHLNNRRKIPDDSQWARKEEQEVNLFFTRFLIIA
jgi:hypothetical protein